MRGSPFIQNVSPQLKRLLAEEREHSMQSQREYVISVLDRAFNAKAQQTLVDVSMPEPLKGARSSDVPRSPVDCSNPSL